MTDPPLLERRTVSRKTPGDGRLEVTSQTARRIESIRSLRVTLDGEPVPAELGSLPCTCRGDETPHLHYFLSAEPFRALLPGSSVDLTLAGGVLAVRTVAPVR